MRAFSAGGGKRVFTGTQKSASGPSKATVSRTASNAGLCDGRSNSARAAAMRAPSSKPPAAPGEALPDALSFGVGSARMAAAGDDAVVAEHLHVVAERCRDDG